MLDKKRVFNYIKPATDEDGKSMYIDIHKLVSNPLNFYTMEDIESLAEAIQRTQFIAPLSVVPIVGTDQYKIIAGHRRREAILKLIQDNKRQSSLVPCMVYRNLSEKREVDILIDSNKEQRKRSVWDRLKEIELLEPYTRAEYEGKVQKGEITGSFRAYFAHRLNLSEAKLQRLRSFKLLIPGLQLAIDSGDLSETAAALLAGKTEEVQQAFYQKLQNGESSGSVADVTSFNQNKQEDQSEVTESDDFDEDSQDVPEKETPDELPKEQSETQEESLPDVIPDEPEKTETEDFATDDVVSGDKEDITSLSATDQAENEDQKPGIEDQKVNEWVALRLGTIVEEVETKIDVETRYNDTEKKEFFEACKNKLQELIKNLSMNVL